MQIIHHAKTKLKVKHVTMEHKTFIPNFVKCAFFKKIKTLMNIVLTWLIALKLMILKKMHV